MTTAGRIASVVLAAGIFAATWGIGHPRWELSAAHPGSVQAHPQIHLVIWGSSHFPAKAGIAERLGPNAASYWATLRQYGVLSEPRLVGQTVHIATPPHSVAQVLAWARARAGAHPNPDTQYLVMVNDKAWVLGRVPGMTNVWGRHFWDSGIAVDIVLSNGMLTAVHEMAEAATDPRVGSGWIGPGGQEVADRCELVTGGQIPVAAGQVAKGAPRFVSVPSLWDQEAGKCVW